MYFTNSIPGQNPMNEAGIVSHPSGTPRIALPRQNVLLATIAEMGKQDFRDSDALLFQHCRLKAMT